MILGKQVRGSAKVPITVATTLCRMTSEALAYTSCVDTKVSMRQFFAHVRPKAVFTYQDLVRCRNDTVIVAKCTTSCDTRTARRFACKSIVAGRHCTTSSDATPAPAGGQGGLAPLGEILAP